MSLSKCKSLIFIRHIKKIRFNQVRDLKIAEQTRNMLVISKTDYGIVFSAPVNSKLKSQSRFASLSSYELLLEDLSLQSMKYC